MKKTMRTKVWWWIIGIAITIVFAVFISIEINIYNRPENRLARQLELGHKYLEDQEYEEAAIAFEQAILIDDKCVEAYLGGMEAYSNIGDEENLQVFYDKTLDMVRNMEEERLEESMEQTVSIYLYADEVYSSSPECAIEILEEGYQATEEDEAVKEKLVEDYMALVLEQAEENVPDEELTIYDRLLDLDEENEQILESLGLCLEDYINSLGVSP